MTWKKTVISNKYSKKELLDVISTFCKDANKTISVGDMFTNGTASLELSELESNPIKGSMCSHRFDDLNAILTISESRDGIDIHADKILDKAARRVRQMFNADFSLFITDEKDGKVMVCAQSNTRTYWKVVEVKGEDVKYDLSQVRYCALYELARLVYNEVNQSTPVKERQMCF